jgi:hypothetical protein
VGIRIEGEQLEGELVLVIRGSPHGVSWTFQQLRQIAGGFGECTIRVEGLQGAKWWFSSNVTDSGAHQLTAGVLIICSVSASDQGSNHPNND